MLYGNKSDDSKNFIWFYRYILSNVNCFLLFSPNSFFSSIFLVYICDYYWKSIHYETWHQNDDGKIEDLAHTNELWGEIVFDESALKVIPYGNTESEYSMEYSRFKDFYILKHYCVFGDKRKIEKGLTQETIIIDKTVLTEADMHNLTSLIHEKMPQVKVHEKERKNNWKTYIEPEHLWNYFIE